MVGVLVVVKSVDDDCHIIARSSHFLKGSAVVKGVDGISYIAGEMKVAYARHSEAGFVCNTLYLYL